MSNIRNLFALNTERREALRLFYAEQASFFMTQASNPAGGAAALSIAVTGASEIVTKLAGIDAAHAAVLLTELDKVRAQLLLHVAELKPDQSKKSAKIGGGSSTGTNVVPMRSAEALDMPR